MKVTDNFFLIGLSNVETDRGRNLQLLKERSWFDIPLVYANQRRAIVALEKGAPGERAFTERSRRGANRDDVVVSFDSNFKQRVERIHVRILAARCVRALRSFAALDNKRAQGKPGAALHPRSRAKRI